MTHKPFSRTSHTGISSYSLKNFITEHDGEEQLVLLEERPADVGVETVREMIRQIAQATLENLRLVAEARFKRRRTQRHHANIGETND